MKVAVFGTGYVGLVTGVCLAEKGQQVLCVDIDTAKIQKLKSGQSPIYEPGLDELLQKNIAAGRIEFSTDLALATNFAEVLMIAVGTPPNEDGSADLSHVLKVAETIAKNMTGDRLILNKSTVPVGTHLRVQERMSEVLQARSSHLKFEVASNPEFLREGCAIEDCLRPARIVVGTQSLEAARLLQDLYRPFIDEGVKYVVMDPLSSEMTKYAANAMLAARISLMNEFARLCEKVGANIDQVKQGIGSDPRIGPQFINAGIGYGGSCFPKDVKALIQTGSEFDEPMQILRAVEDVNREQRQRFLAKIKSVIHHPLAGRKIAIWGVAFKPGTDDIREAPAIDLIEDLLRAGAFVVAFDPVAQETAQERLKDHHNLTFAETMYEATQQADALCICTEWLSFREPDFVTLKATMKSPIIFDGRNLYSTNFVNEQGFVYHSIGRGAESLRQKTVSQLNETDKTLTFASSIAFRESN